MDPKNIRNIAIIAQVDVASLPHNLSVLSNFLHRETPVSPTPFSSTFAN